MKRIRDYLFKRSSVKKVLIIFLLSLSFSIGLITSYIFLNLSRIFVKFPKEAGNNIEEKEITINDSYNILLLGYGGAGHDGGNLTDVIIVANINTVRKKVTFTSIPRDFWVEIPIRSDIKQNFKINAAYAIGLDDTRYALKEPIYKGEAGGANLAKKVVSDVSGLHIDYFVSVNFDQFKKIIDSLGGVEVDVPVTFNDYFYPVKGLENETCGKSANEIAILHQKYSGFDLEKQFECRYEHLHFEKGKTKIDGETALKFVRSRHSVEHGGDYARSQRQQAVFLAIKDKLISLDLIKNLSEIFNEFAGMVKTDLDLTHVKKIAGLVANPRDYKVSFISLNEDNVLVATKSMDGQFILIPKEGEGVWNKVQKFIYDSMEAN